ncbi:expressed unknown protein [Seminavis robusta]|uniref:Uncharacterized protein n=1 Tax=Seminavis robusta TaxID=568900 RepID=A0A9N8END5_9STRA|nr:expressed unknown protein [Seminavis robusta]|eukprot:Sro1519_g279280.1 n/a (123) ;mRNA; f:7902-8270
MIRRQLWIVFLSLVVLLASQNDSLAFAQQEQSTIASGSAPGEGDIAIMQKEIKWGMQEMQRYKMLTGEWPVRAVEDPIVEVPSSRRELEVAARKKPKPTGTRGASMEETPHSTYWKLLVSVF